MRVGTPCNAKEITLYSCNEKKEFEQKHAKIAKEMQMWR